jgi:hypothetical protein
LSRPGAPGVAFGPPFSPGRLSPVGADEEPSIGGVAELPPPPVPPDPPGELPVVVLPVSGAGLGPGLGAVVDVMAGALVEGTAALVSELTLVLGSVVVPLLQPLSKLTAAAAPARPKSVARPACSKYLMAGL